MTSAQICIMIAIIVYLIGMIYIGFRCSKKNNSTDDFYLPDMSRTTAELSPEEKNAVSHRGKALEAMKEQIASYLK